MEDRYSHIINTLKEVKTELSTMDQKEAVSFLHNETNIDLDECEKAYDFFMKVDLDQI